LVDDQRANPPYGSNLTYPLGRFSRFFKTSATSGQPMCWLDTPASFHWMLDNWTRVYEAAGVTADDRIFFAFGFGPFLGFWTAYAAAGRMGCLMIPGGGMRSVERARLLIDHEATVLCATPTYSIWLAEAAAEAGVDLSHSHLRRIIVAGEPGGSIPATRSRIESLWNGAKVVDHHGMTEVGPVSYGCPIRTDVLHVIEASFIPEVIDPVTGQAVEPGKTGELVLTNLGRPGSPVLRYRTGDIVRQAPGGPCECGTWEMALEGGIISRTDDMVVVRGVNVFPSAIEDVVRRFDEIVEYRVEVNGGASMTELTVEIEPTGDAGDLSRRLEAEFHSLLGLRIPVRTVAAGSLDRFELKARRWVRR